MMLGSFFVNALSKKSFVMDEICFAFVCSLSVGRLLGGVGVCGRTIFNTLGCDTRGLNSALGMIESICSGIRLRQVRRIQCVSMADVVIQLLHEFTTKEKPFTSFNDGVVILASKETCVKGDIDENA
jgi:hypothetical protein